MAIGVVAVMWLDGFVAGRIDSSALPPTNLTRWLCNGAICTALVLLLTLLATRELVHFAHCAGFRPLRFVVYVFGAGLVIGPYVSLNLSTTSTAYDESWGVFWMALALALAFLLQAVRRGTQQVLVNLATTMFILLYAGGFAGYMTKMRMEICGAAGAYLLLFSMFIVKITDVGAYFAGRALGRTKFIPWLSPNKTWEGVAGGLVVATAMAVAVGLAMKSAGVITDRFGFFATPMGLAVFGLVMAAFSIAGDLAESLLKRDAALKDSGNLIPGMGGILDVLDSPLLAAPAAWFIWTRLCFATVP